MNTQYNKEMLLFVESLSNQINEGDTFSNALQNQTIYEIPNFYIETIKVSESRGQLDKALIELSSYLKKSVTTEEKIKSALTYPVFLITISISIIIFMMTYIVPEISNMFQENNQKLPNITEIVLNTSNFISTNIFYIVFIIITIIITYKILIKNKKIKLIKDKFLLKVPLVKRLIISSELSKFSYIAILLSKSGLTFIDVIQLSSKTITNDFLRNILIEASKNIEEGQKLSFVLKKQKKFIFDEQFTQAILLGEETSKIEISLKNIKNLYELEYDNKINKFLSLLEPTMMLIVGGVIGTIVIAMLLPIFSMDVLS
jgi:general secretion pathway protein F/type IV pilus assembly protein PilC